MSANSKIKWTTYTWKPVLGRSKFSRGCKPCYGLRDLYRTLLNPNAKLSQANAGLAMTSAESPTGPNKCG